MEHLEISLNLKKEGVVNVEEYLKKEERTIYAIINARGVPHQDREDMFQDIAIRAIRYYSTCREPNGGWVRSVANSEITEWWKKRIVRIDNECDFEYALEVAQPHLFEDDIIEAHDEERIEVRKQFFLLPENYQVAIMADLAGLSGVDLGKKFGITRRAARFVVRRAYDRLRSQCLGLPVQLSRIAKAVIVDGKKKCKRCQRMVPIEGYGKDCRTSLGITTYCLACNRQGKHESYERKKKNYEDKRDGNRTKIQTTIPA